MKRKVFCLGLGFGVLILAGCFFPLNQVAESPTGELAVILDGEGNYDPFPLGGAVWLLGERGERERALLELGEAEAAGGLVWSPSGSELLVTVLELDEDFLFPRQWKLLQVSLTGEPELLLQTEYPLSSARYDQTGSAILYIASPEKSLELHRLDLISGEDRVLAGDVLTYLPVGGALWLVRPEGRVESGEGETVANFLCGEEDCQLFLFLWPELFLDVAPGGEVLALVVADQPGLTSPQVDPATSLYLVDVRQSSAQRLATPALSPAFSPDGRRLAFLAGTPEGTQQVCIYDLESSELTIIPGGEGAFWVKWSQGGLLIGVEEPDGVFRLLRWEGTRWQELGSPKPS